MDTRKRNTSIVEKQLKLFGDSTTQNVPHQSKVERDKELEKIFSQGQVNVKSKINTIEELTKIFEAGNHKDIKHYQTAIQTLKDPTEIKFFDDIYQASVENIKAELATDLQNFKEAKVKKMSEEKFKYYAFIYRVTEKCTNLLVASYYQHLVNDMVRIEDIATYWQYGKANDQAALSLSKIAEGFNYLKEFEDNAKKISEIFEKAYETLRDQSIERDYYIACDNEVLDILKLIKNGSNVSIYNMNAKLKFISFLTSGGVIAFKVTLEAFKKRYSQWITTGQGPTPETDGIVTYTGRVKCHDEVENRIAANSKLVHQFTAIKTEVAKQVEADVRRGKGIGKKR